MINSSLQYKMYTSKIKFKNLQSSFYILEHFNIVIFSLFFRVISAFFFVHFNNFICFAAVFDFIERLAN